MKVLVTGASGFIGSNVVEMLASQPGYEILATGRTSTQRFLSLPSVKYFQQDLLNISTTLPCEIAIHCAGLADDRSSREALMSNNVEVTSNLLSAVKDCRLFIYISSASVYDFSEGQPMKEEDIGPEAKLSHYGLSKLMAEKIIANSTIPSIYILRPRAVYGPGDRVLLPRILELIKNKKMIIPGKLSTNTSLTHVDNLCEAINVAIHQSKPGVHTYNISDRKTYNLREVFSFIALRKTGQTRFIQIPSTMIRLLAFVNSVLGIKGRLNKQSIQYLSQQSVLNIDKTRKELGYTGKHNFFEGLDQLDI